MSSQVVETGGFDMLVLGLYGEWQPGRFDATARELEQRQERAKEGDGAGAVIETRWDKLQVWPTGAKLGVYYRWAFTWNGCRVYVLNSGGESSGKFADVVAQIGSLALMTQGVDAVVLQLHELLADFGFRVVRDKVSRVDLCVDLPGVHVSEFTSLAQSGCEITKARNGRLHFGAKIGDHETFYRGGQRVLMRIYDKLKEVANDPAKEAALEAKRWGGKVKVATRVEFEVGREFLRENPKLGVETLDDLKRALPVLVELLTEQWYRLTARPVDRENKNHSRAETSPLWRKVQQAFVDWVVQPAVVWIAPAKVLETKAEHLCKMAVGCIAKAIAIREPVTSGVGDVLQAVQQIFFAARERVVAGVEEARLLLGVSYGQSVEWDPTEWAYQGPDAPPVRRLEFLEGTA